MWGLVYRLQQNECKIQNTESLADRKSQDGKPTSPRERCWEKGAHDDQFIRIDANGHGITGTFLSPVSGTRSSRIFRIRPGKFTRWGKRHVFTFTAWGNTCAVERYLRNRLRKKLIVFYLSYLAKRVFGRKNGRHSKWLAWRRNITLSASRPNCDLRHIAWLLFRT